MSCVLNCICNLKKMLIIQIFQIYFRKFSLITLQKSSFMNFFLKLHHQYWFQNWKNDVSMNDLHPKRRCCPATILYFSLPLYVPLIPSKIQFFVFSFSTNLKSTKLNWGKPNNLCSLLQKTKEKCLMMSALGFNHLYAHRAVHSHLKKGSKDWRACIQHQNNRLILRTQKRQINRPMYTSCSEYFQKGWAFCNVLFQFFTSLNIDNNFVSPIPVIIESAHDHSLFWQSRRPWGAFLTTKKNS